MFSKRAIRIIGMVVAVLIIISLVLFEAAFLLV